MRRLFPRWSDTALRLGLLLFVLGGAAAVAAPMIYVRTPYNTGQRFPVEQPIEFDHRHHVQNDGIDCRYCHRTVETAASAGIPATDLCMGCHSQIRRRTPLTEPMRSSYFSGSPIQWNRVHKLPDHVYFNHAIHLKKGVGCSTCHGRIDQMARVYQVAPLTMGWCLDCHLEPAKSLRPRDRITQMAWKPSDPGEGERLAREYQVHTLTHCTVCHR